MRLSLLAPALFLVACGSGKDEDSGIVPPSCDDIVTSPLPSLTPDQYPEGLGEGIEALRNLEGLWRGTHCLPDFGNREISIKITDMPAIPDEVQVVDQSVDESALCGCAADPDYAHDNALDLVAMVPPFILFVDPDVIAPIDVSVDQQEFEVSGALYAGEQGLFFRACQTKRVEPYLNSEYDNVAVNIRIQTKAEATPLSQFGQVTMGLSLIKQGAADPEIQCDVVDFAKVN